MKITYFKEKNSIGIFAGMGLESIEFNFPKKSNRITMLLGANGGGKTSLLSLLQPYRETFDERTIIFNEEEGGYKELHLENNSDKYVIKHFYGKGSSKNKSFISKNGIEMNENGGVRTYEAYLKEEFNLDKDYFKVGKLGSNVTTFIDLSTAKRKEYMNKLIPNIDEYLEAYNVINDKFKLSNNLLKSAQNSLNKLTNEDDLIDTLKIYQDQLEEFNSIISKNENKISNMEGKNNLLFENLNLELDENNSYENIMDELESFMDKLEENIILQKDSLNKFFEKHSSSKNKLSKYSLNDCIERINTLDNEIKDIQRITESNLDSIIICKNQYTDNNTQIKKFNSQLSSNNLNDLIQSYNNYNNSLVDLQKKINDELSLFSKYQDKINYDLISDIRMILNRIKPIIEDNDIFILNSDLYKSEFITIDNNNEYKLIDIINNKDLWIKYLTMLEETIEKHKIYYNDLNTQINKIENKTDLLNTLKKRPSNCKNNNCSFIINAYDYKINEYSKLDKLYEDLQSTKEYINKTEIEYNEISSIMNLFNNIKLVYNDIKKLSVDNEIKDIIFGKSIENFIENLKYGSNFINDINKKINNLSNLYSTIKNINDITKQIEMLESTIEITKKQEKMQIEIKSSILELKNKNESIISKIDDLENENNDNELKITRKNKAIKIINELKIYLEELDKLNKEQKDFNKNFSDKKDILEKIKDNREVIYNYKSEIHTIKPKIKSLQSKINNINNELAMINGYKNQIKEIEDNYEIIKIMKDSLDPKKGIPLFFIDKYVESIAIKANELLDIAYEGKFKIKFNITSSDFFINVFKSDGTFLEDIKQASQGEVSLTSISLSLAIIETLMEKSNYNILYLDEIDSTLSTKNRRLFIELLEKQLDKLNIEQVFVISHNNEYFTYPINMILTKESNVETDDKEFMEGKYIIFNTTKI